jgi:hypothetical protein
LVVLDLTEIQSFQGESQNLAYPTYQPVANGFAIDKLEHQNILDNPAPVSSSRDGNNLLAVHTN